MIACQRCHTLTAVTPKGALWLCGACDLLPFCGEFQHTYVGHTTAEQWVCLRCGQALASHGIQEEAPPPPSAPTYDYACYSGSCKTFSISSGSS